MSLKIDVVSDVICPWCFVGKRRLEKAIRLLDDETSVPVWWHPFQLNPDMPPEGMERKAYRTAKFGSWERSLALDARLAAVGKTEGIEFAFDRIERTPNTFDAHRLIARSQREGWQDAIVEALFESYFVEGKNVGDRETLIAIASGAGMNAEAVRRFLESEDGVNEVRKDEATARRRGISAVPYFIINDTYAIEGAEGAEVLLSTFREAMK